MENGEGTTVDDAVSDISELLATAYLRYSRAPAVRAGDRRRSSQQNALITRENRALMG